ncbi:MAG: hypothetical protein LBC40_06050 [Dysgonamonadaceae bacterium]|jgi:hypothetical protein|nr:hypothetical protein [Dysgonamonadaceae bacterium]
MKHVKSVLLLAMIMVSMAHTTRDAKISEGLTPGSRMPEIHLQQFSLAGKYTLLQFWAAYDATSRAGNVLIANRLAKMPFENVRMVSVSFDENVSVFNETVKVDNLPPSTLLFNDLLGRKSEIFRNYRLAKGFTNLLIDPHGVILAVNISPDKLRDILETIEALKIRG